MESYEFPLVRDLCLSRNELLRSYPSTVKEIRFLTTVEEGFRHHPLLLYAGAWVYWLIGSGKTRVPKFLTRRSVEVDEPVVNTKGFAGAIEYSDAYLYDNDARFVFNFVRDALTRGAVAVNYVEAAAARFEQDRWQVSLRDRISNSTFDLRASVLVNAAGGGVDEFNRQIGHSTHHRHVFSKGIHLIVNRLTPNKRVLAFFADDGRLFFVIPMGDKTCLGTTDTRVDKPESEVTGEDRDFVLDNINRRLKLPRPLDRDDIIAERCGVRPLVVKGDSAATQDFLQLSRRHEIEISHPDKQISIFGGKLTDCLNIGNEVCELAQQLGIALRQPKFRWFGEAEASIREEFLHQASLMDLDNTIATIDSESISDRLWRRYGINAIALLEQIRAEPRQADKIIEGADYLRCELHYASQHEMIVKLEDFLRRRSKLALMMRKEALRQSKGLVEACEILFGPDAKARYDEYFTRND